MVTRAWYLAGSATSVRVDGFVGSVRSEDGMVGQQEPLLVGVGNGDGRMEPLVGCW